MKTIRIMIKDFVTSDTAISYDDGKKCLNEILKNIDTKEKIILDFTDIKYVITAFLNPIIGDLILQKGKSIMSKIKIEHATENIVEKIAIVKNGSLLKREDMMES